MKTVISVPDLDQKGNVAYTTTHILAGSTITIDEDNPAGQVIYSFSKEDAGDHPGLYIVGEVRSAIVFDFTSKYALSLYELITVRVNMKHVWEQSLQWMICARSWASNPASCFASATCYSASSPRPCLRYTARPTSGC
jgi:hypothetical protein